VSPSLGPGSDLVTACGCAAIRTLPGINEFAHEWYGLFSGVRKNVSVSLPQDA
jgi:hypothetical protein